MEEQILSDFKDAMKNKDSARVSTLSFLRAQFSYAALDKKKDKLEDADCLVVIKKLIKQHQDSIEQFTAGNRMDLVEREAKELDILKSYVPVEMSAEQLKKVIDEIIVSIGTVTMREMGKVMKDVLAKTAGKADGKMISDLVKERLTKGSW
jgi:uncharacterized protein YqeY